MAFVLSLLLPGLGQIYCGQKRRAAWTFFFLALGAVCVIAFAGSAAEGGSLFLGIGLRTVLVLYGFSFLDAYFTAQEMSKGTHQLLHYNPRVAAVLNLLTRGFGYWYVDEKKKGVILFFVVGIADRVALASHETRLTTVLFIFVEIALTVMAVDAYRIATRANEQALMAGHAAPLPVQPGSGLKPAIPLAFASLLVLAYLTLAVVGIAVPEDENPDQSQAVVKDTPDGSAYVNGKYRTELPAPREWTVQKGEEKEFARAEYMDGACSVILTRTVGLPLISTHHLPDQLLKEIQKEQPSFKLVTTKPSELGGKAAHDIIFSADVKGIVVTQTYAYVEDGFWLNFVVITEAEPLRESCDPAVQSIRKQIVLPH